MMKRSTTIPEGHTMSPPPSPPLRSHAQLPTSHSMGTRPRRSHGRPTAAAGQASKPATTVPTGNTSFLSRLRTAAQQLANTTIHSTAGTASAGSPDAATATHRHDVDSPLPPGAERNVLQWPLIMLALPPIGSLFFGTAQGWSDGITLVLIGIYLYYLVKIPWELYYAAQVGQEARRAALAKNATPAQRDALRRLKRQEHFSLLLVLLAPLMSGLTLHVAKSQLSMAQYLTPTNIFLYMIAVSMRPITHLINLFQGNTVRMKRDLSIYDSDVAQLRRRLDQLELSLRELRLACATEDDVDNLKEEVLSVLDKVSRGTMEQQRRMRRLRQEAQTRLDSAEERVRSVEEWCELERHRHGHSLAARFVWEPVSLLREAVGMASVPLLGFSRKPPRALEAASETDTSSDS
jgi:hypothetical protein